MSLILCTKPPAGGFDWPKAGHFDSRGRPLRGLEWGEGNADALGHSPGCDWLVAKVPDDLIVRHDGAAYFFVGEVVYYGHRLGATSYLRENGGRARRIHFDVLRTSDYHHVFVGDYGVAVTGRCGTAEAGNFGVAKCGKSGLTVAGAFGFAHGGLYAVAKSGVLGYAVTGDYGWSSVLTHGHAKTGAAGRAQALGGGIVEGGDEATLIIHDVCGVVGQNSLKANTPYCLRDGKFVEVLRYGLVELPHE